MTLSRRQSAAGPNAHLWRNSQGRGPYWIAYTAFPTPVTKTRIRHSLGTTDVIEARRKRDAIFASLA